MALAAGQRLGPYEIIAPLGAGGMGEVYRAKDTRLGRDVAVKILSGEFASNQNRLDRFSREARAASALNHPNIITVHDVGEQSAVSYIAMELIEGVSLRDLLQGGAMPVKRVVSIATQIADGLAKAHEAGIVHRDLKPENIMISKDGFVKILDFGLAKASGAVPAQDTSGLSTALHTSEGTILGTVGYMSPEQAAAKPVDFRSDQFTFGSILYEMLTGRRAFERDTAVQCLSAIIQDEPESLQALSAQTPAPVRWVIERCMSKDPGDRYASTRDLARELQGIRDHFSDLTSSAESLSQQVVTRPSSVHRWMKFLPWLLLVAVTALFAVRTSREKTAPASTVPHRLEIAIPRGYQLAPNTPLAISPDGSSIMFGLLDRQMQTKLWFRSLDSFDSRPIPGTEGAAFPFWSPDSKSIAFFAEGNGTLRRLELSSGSTRVICKTFGNARGGAWSPGGIILFAPGTNSPIMKVPATGGTPQEVTHLDPSLLDGSHRFPVFLPDGQHFLFTVWSNDEEAAERMGGVYLGALSGGEIRKLCSDLSQVALVGSRQLLIYRNNKLQLLGFDPEKGAFTGTGEEIASNVMFLQASGTLSASGSDSGDYAYAIFSGEGTAQLAWVDTEGKEKLLSSERMSFLSLEIAPDGKRVAAQIASPSGADIWVGDTDRAVMTRITRGGVDATGPVWSADSRMIAFTSKAPNGNESVFLQPSDGSKLQELFYTDPDRTIRVRTWSSDGRAMLLEATPRNGPGRSEIWKLDVASKKATLLLSDPFGNLTGPVLSPDDRWLAYVSDESGTSQVYVRPYPELDRKWQISDTGVLTQSNLFALASTMYLPHWRSDSRELLFISGQGSIEAAAIDAQGSNIVVGSLRALFKPSFPVVWIAPSPDHTRFLAAIPPGDVTSEPIRVVLP